jgi:hypothetical protein
MVVPGVLIDMMRVVCLILKDVLWGLEGREAEALG